ncbi:hypothetical protein M446_1461 [Methylobacterium sp. 4-46]|nr:hypothetical protein M446_1461 [Methylobacterium sp. 4-46]
MLYYTDLDLPLCGWDEHGLTLNQAEHIIAIAEQARGTGSARNLARKELAAVPLGASVGPGNLESSVERGTASV